MALKYAEDVIAAEFDDQNVILNLKTGYYYVMDEVASRIWELIGQSYSKEQIIDTLYVAYEVDKSQLTDDIQELLDKLIEVGLILREP